MSTRTFLIAILLVTAGCGSSHMNKGSDACKEAIRHELFFGRERNGEFVVTDQRWDDFLNAEVKDRLAGFTVMDAKGQWTENGNIEEEPSKVMIVVAPGKSDVVDSLTVIVDAYKRTFDQYSVGWVRDKVCVDGFW